MKNLKKTLAVVLAFAMVLSMGAVSTFAAYSDVTAGTVVSEAVDILSGLKILTGFEDGTFKPEDTVTRAQMAAIICRTLGYEDQAQSSMGATVFNDVPASHWAAGYINVAQAQGIINGYGDGNFGPEDLVTYEQAVKMIVSALGYDVAAQRKGGYPTGYLAIASAEGITKKANGRVGDAAARGTIAVLVYNSLEVNLMDQNAWSTDGTDTFMKDDANVLGQYLDVKKVEGVLTNAPIMQVAAANKFVADTTPQVNLSSFKEWDFDSNKNFVLGGNAGLTNVNVDKVSVDGLLGKHVIAYVGEDALTGADTIVSISDASNKNLVKKISSVQLGTNADKDDDKEGVINYKEIGATKLDQLELDASAVLYTNYENAISAGIDTDLVRNIFTAGGTVEFISNDGDDKYDYILVTAYDDEAVITSVEEYNGEYTFMAKEGSMPDLDTAEEDGFVIVYKDGALATAADLAENDTVSHVKYGKDCYVVYASSKTVTGEVESYNPDNNTITIAGTDYEKSPAYAKSLNTFLGEAGIYFLNVDGQIAYSDTDPTAVANYALVTALYEELKGGNTVAFVEAVLADGTVVTYEVKDTAKHKELDGDYSGTSAINYLKGLMDQEGSNPVWKVTIGTMYGTDGTDGKAPIVKLGVKNDKVTLVTEISDNLGSNDYFSAADYNATSNKIAGNKFDESTVAFSIKEDASAAVNFDTDDDGTDDTVAITAEDVKVGKVADFMVDDEAYTGYAFDKDRNIYGVVIGLAMAQPIDALSDAFVITRVSKKSIDYSDAFIVTGLQAGEERTVTIYDEDANYGGSTAELVKGNVLLLAEEDANGYVSKFHVLYNNTTPVRAAGVDADDEVYYGAGTVTAVDSDGYFFKIDAAIKDEADNSQKWAAGHEIEFEAADYVLVDYSESTNPVIDTANGSKNLFRGYASKVYVRYVDGELKEVVVYRLAEDELVVAADEVNAGDTAVTFTYTTGATLSLSNAVCDNGGVTVAINGNQIDVTGSLVAGDEITVEYSIAMTGYTTVTGSLTIVVE